MQKPSTNVSYIIIKTCATYYPIKTSNSQKNINIDNLYISWMKKKNLNKSQIKLYLLKIKTCKPIPF